MRADVAFRLTNAVARPVLSLDVDEIRISALHPGASCPKVQHDDFAATGAAAARAARRDASFC